MKKKQCILIHLDYLHQKKSAIHMIAGIIVMVKIKIQDQYHVVIIVYIFRQMKEGICFRECLIIFNEI